MRAHERLPPDYRWEHAINFARLAQFARTQLQAIVAPSGRRYGDRECRNRGSRMWTDRRTKIDALTGLRAVAALSILALHTTEWTAPFTAANSITSIAQILGTYGMPLFFVLSGFVIHYNYSSLFRSRSWSWAVGEFFIARFARLYPLYLFCVCVGFVSDDMVRWLTDYRGDFFKAVITFLTLTQSWVYIVVVNHRILLDNAFGLGWSVSAEWFFYCAYAGLVFAVLRFRGAAATLGAIVIFALAAFAALALGEAHLSSLVAWAQHHLTADSAVTSGDSGFARWLFYYSPYVRVLEFILGALAAHLYILVSETPVSYTEATVGKLAQRLALVVLILIGVLQDTGTPWSFVDEQLRFFVANFGCAVPIAILIFCVSRYKTRVAMLLASRPWVALGEISYSIYAVHTWTLRAFLRPAEPPDALGQIEALIRIPLAMVFTIIMATATYRLIEAPSRRYLRDRLPRLRARFWPSRGSGEREADVSPG
jgi:peptidoglycan/LPS O-acetylase OafA/YrhL